MNQQKATLKYRVQNEQVVLCVEIDGDDKVVQTMDECVTYSGLYLDGDKLIYEQKRGQDRVLNLSCRVLRISRFRRNLTGLLRDLINEHHPLNRVFVVNKKCNFWCIPYEEHLRHRYFKECGKEESD